MTDPEDKVRNWREQLEAEELAHDEIAFRKWRAQRKLTEGGPAFPVREFSGMTLRDYFAAAALTGLMANPSVAMKYEDAAEFVFKQADAMLERRNA